MADIKVQCTECNEVLSVDDSMSMAICRFCGEPFDVAAALENYNAHNKAADNFNYVNQDFEIENGVLKKYTGNAQHVVIPNGVTTIDTEAFSYNLSINSVVIPGSVKTIKEKAFLFCMGLMSVNLSDGLETIDVGAFTLCDSLLSITIPKTVTKIGPGAFMLCCNLCSINVDEKNDEFVSIDGVLFSRDKTALVQYPVGKNNNTYNIPHSVTTIWPGAFNKCERITHIEIPDSVTIIYNFAFCKCINLERVVIPDSVTEICDNAFIECPNLSQVSISKDLLLKSKAAFPEDLYQKLIKQVADSETEAPFEDDDDEFVIDLYEDEDEDFEYEIDEDDDEDFEYELDLDEDDDEDFELKLYVDDDEGFEYEIDVDDEEIELELDDDEDGTFDEDGFLIKNGVLVKYKGTLPHVIIPDNVTEIAESAFQECENIETVIISESVKRIGSHAFAQCKNLKAVEIPDNVEHLGWFAFGWCDNLCEVVISKELLSDFRMAFDTDLFNKLVIDMGAEDEIGLIELYDPDDLDDLE